MRDRAFYCRNHPKRGAEARYFIADGTKLYSHDNMLTERRLSSMIRCSVLILGGMFVGLGASVNDLTKEEKSGGWKLLFDGKTTQGWRSFKQTTFPQKGWVVEDGWLHCLGKGGGDIITDREFDDFELQWEWKQAPGGNSGVK